MTASAESQFARGFVAALLLVFYSECVADDGDMRPVSLSAFESVEAASVTCEPGCGASTCDLCPTVDPCTDCWLDGPGLKLPRNETLFGDWHHSVGGALRHRYMGTVNRAGRRRSTPQRQSATRRGCVHAPLPPAPTNPTPSPPRPAHPTPHTPGLTRVDTCLDNF